MNTYYINLLLGKMKEKNQKIIGNIVLKNVLICMTQWIFVELGMYQFKLEMIPRKSIDQHA